MHPQLFLLMIILLAPHQSTPTPTFTWLQSQLKSLQNLTSKITSTFTNATTSIQTQISMRSCTLMISCLNDTECVDIIGGDVEIATMSPPQGSPRQTCPGDAMSRAECWWDKPGCVITKRVPPCACGTNLK